LATSLAEPKKRRIEPGQQLLDFRDLNERGLFADRKKFLCAHELRQVEIDNFGLDHHLRRLDADGVEADILHFEGTEQRSQA
jgi:hypothetical protein